MRSRGTPYPGTWLALVVVMLGVCGGCKERAVEATGKDGGVDASALPLASNFIGRMSDGGAYPPEERLTINRRWFRMAGQIDLTSRYPSTVEIRTPEPQEAGIEGNCSGVIIGPRLILTAGHCVCMKRSASTPGGEGKSIIDASSCDTHPVVKTFDYDRVPPVLENTTPGYRSWEYEAVEIRPHPEFKLILDEQGQVVAGGADLAVILLREPVQSLFPAVLLADTEVQVGELIIMVSYTYDEIVGGIVGQRRVNHYKVSDVLPSGGRVLFDQPGRSTFKGDSGGPCLRWGSNGAMIVGVSGRGLGETPFFTSTYRYRDWVRAEIIRAARTQSATHPK